MINESRLNPFLQSPLFAAVVVERKYSIENLREKSLDENVKRVTILKIELNQ